MCSKVCFVWDDMSNPMRSAPNVLNSIKRNMSGETDYVEHLEEVHRMHADQPKIIQEATDYTTEVFDADYRSQT